MLVLEGVRNFLQLVNDNWTTIVVIIGLGIGAYHKIKSYVSLSNKQKTDLAWDAISETILSMVSDAESNYSDWKKAGEIKRAEVIDRIFAQYPILELVTDKAEVIKRIDKLIDESLDTVNDIFKKNAGDCKDLESR